MKEVTDLDWCFETKTKVNGYKLYQKNKIYVKNDKNKYNSIIFGNKVWIEFSDSKCDCYDDFHCDCDEYEENGECKHIYALVCAIKKVSKNLDVNFNEIDSERNKRKVTEVQLFPPREYEENIKKIKVRSKKRKFNIFKFIFNILLLPGKILFGFLGILFGFHSNTSKSVNDLEDWQDDLVKNGKYDKFNFEEEELEEDDYYYEDK